MPKISTVAAELLKTRSGGEANLNKALGIVLCRAKRAEGFAERLSERLDDMQVRVEVAAEDLHRRDREYLAHIEKVRDLLDCKSEEDLYEKIRTLKMHRVLAGVALANAGTPFGRLLSFIGDRAEELAGLATANAALFRDNVRLMQELEALREAGRAELDAANDRFEALLNDASIDATDEDDFGPEILESPPA